MDLCACVMAVISTRDLCACVMAVIYSIVIMGAVLSVTGRWGNFLIADTCPSSYASYNFNTLVPLKMLSIFSLQYHQACSLFNLKVSLATS